MKGISTIITVFTLFWFCDGARILISAPCGTKSHQNTFGALTKELVRRHHHVTVVSNYANAELQKLQDVHEIILDELKIDISIFPDVFAALKMSAIDRIKQWVNLIQLGLRYSTKIVEKTYKDPRIINLIGHDQFDLVLVSHACGVNGYPLAWHFQAPSIVVSPNVMFPGMANTLGDSDHTEHVPMLFSSYSDRMNVLERLINTVTSDFIRNFLINYGTSEIQKIVNQVLTLSDYVINLNRANVGTLCAHGSGLGIRLCWIRLSAL